MYYFHKGEGPMRLPFRIHLSNGKSRTNPSTFTETELRDAGYVKASEEVILSEYKKEVKKEVATIRYEKEVGGVTINGTPFLTDRGSQSMMSGALAYFSTFPDNTVRFKTASGVFMDIDAATMGVVAGAVGSHVQACFSHESDLCSTIDSAESVEEIDSVDLTAGWPSTEY